MLHELLLALSGYPGSIFIKGPDDEIQIVSELPFIHSSEAAVLNRLCRLASQYTRYVAFINKHGHSPTYGQTVGVDGLYMRTMCQGLDEVLEPYRNALLDVERQLLADPHLTAASVQSALEEYQALFPALSSVLDQIQQQKAHGCHILEVLHKAAVSGIPIVRRALQRVLHVCHRVLYKQLVAWMLHGMLLDQYHEFFIQQMQASDGTAGTLSQMMTQQAEEDELGLGGVTGKQLQQILQIQDVIRDRTYYYRFGIRAEMLPSYIPTRLAEKILFVGESVQMFEGEKHSQKHRDKGSILKSREDQFAKELQALSALPHFSVMVFEGVIDKIRGFVAEQLWKLVVEESDLPGHLRIIKDFYLLGRGELFLALIDQAEQLLREPPTVTTQHDVNMTFQQAARNVLFEDEGLMQRFKLSVETDGTGGRHPQVEDLQPPEGASGAETGWTLLSLEYSIEWPLHILFTPSVLNRYNTLFKFLLYVKRIQLELQHCWALQMKRKHLGHEDTGATKWWLRNHMAFLIDNLQYYLQVDVIESHFSILLEKIQSTRDFEAIRLAHDQLLTSLLSQTFLLTKPISRCLNELLELCHNFCGLMAQAEVCLTPQEESQLDTITKSFQRHSNLLFRILSSVRSHQAAPHLAQLLLRIDFNKYFTLAGGQLGRYDTLTAAAT